MRISVVHTVTWEPAEWERLRALGDVCYSAGYPSGEDELIARIGDAQIVVGADVPFTARVIESGPALEMLSLWSTGYNNVDLAAARRCGLTVTNVPGYSAYSVAEHAWGMVLHLAKRLGEGDAHVRAGGFDWAAIEGLEIHGLTAGIIGTGHIGSVSAAIAAGLGCRVVCYTRHPDRERAATLGVTYVTLPELLGQSDIVLVHASLTAATRGLLDRDAFAAMARRPILINTARAAIVEIDALLDALESGALRGVGLDVLWDEPPDWSSPSMRRLLSAKNVVLSPHCGSHTEAAFRRLTGVCIDNVEAYLRGSPSNVVAG